MASKEIIDNHFTSNYNYYQSICYKYCRGNDIYKDLLHRTYEKFLEVKEEVILKFHSLNRLYNLGLRIIRSLYQKRYQLKYNKQGSTSELALLSGKYDIADYVMLQAQWADWDDEYKYKEDCKINEVLNAIHESERKFSELEFLDLEKSINELLVDPRKTVSVTIFLQATETSINELSRNSGISRYYLTNKYKEGLNHLKTQIQNECENRNTEIHPNQQGNVPVLDKTKRKIAA